jgi:uncharacterized protein
LGWFFLSGGGDALTHRRVSRSLNAYSSARPSRNTNHLMKRLATSFLLIVVTVFLAGCGILFVRQADMIVPPFGPERVDQTIAQPAPRGLDAKRLSFEAEAGVTVQGWAVPPNVSARDGARVPVVLLFMGNYEEPSEALRYLRDWFPGAWLVSFNYRGQGLSGGAASEAALFADSLRIYDAAAKLEGADPTRMRVFGRSLGTGVATYLATRRSIERMALISPYDSIRAVAQSQFPIVPVSLLLRHPFDSLARAPQVKVPTLFVVGGRDTLISPAHSRRLFDAWGGAKEWFEARAEDHNSILDARNVAAEVSSYMK